MPIVYIHGVATRDRAHPFAELEVLFRRYIAPEISSTPADVPITQAFWGDLGAHPAYGGISRPRTLLRGQGAETPASTLDQLKLLTPLRDRLGPALDARSEPAPPAVTGGLVAAGPAPVSPHTSAFRLSRLGPDELSDLLVEALGTAGLDPDQVARWTIAADEVARDPVLLAAMAKAPGLEQEWGLLAAALQARATAGTLQAQGFLPNWLVRLGDQLGEDADRVLASGAALLSLGVVEFRAPVNALATNFIGDVLAYLKTRGDADPSDPGPIQRRFLDALADAQHAQAARGGEPIVLISHSMGGQIVYDALTHFIARDGRFQDLKITLWCAAASQVGFFEELKLFSANSPDYHSGKPAPFPGKYLQRWVNAWDPNDVISFSAHDIIEGVDDWGYFSGVSLKSAHSAYLHRPSFLRELALKLRDALVAGQSA